MTRYEHPIVKMALYVSLCVFYNYVFLFDILSNKVRSKESESM